MPTREKEDITSRAEQHARSQKHLIDNQARQEDGTSAKGVKV